MTLQSKAKTPKKKRPIICDVSTQEGLPRSPFAQRDQLFAQLDTYGRQLLEDPHNEMAYRGYCTTLDQLPDAAHGYNDLAITLSNLGRPDRAEACFCRAIALQGDQASFHNNLGRLLRDLGRTEDAIGCYHEAIRLQGDYANAQWNLALALLATGQYREGWQRFAWRTCADLPTIQESHRQTVDHLWQGEPFPGRRLLIRYEQGLGDNIQMARYLPQIKARGGTVVLETLPPLYALFKNLPGVDELVIGAPNGQTTTDYDLCTFGLDLPRVFQTELGSIPAPPAYLQSDPEKRALWQTKLQGPEYKVGIVWAGSARHTNDARRSCHLSQFYPLTELENVMLFSLQKGPAQAQFNVLENHRIVDLAPYLRDFSDTAAVIDNLDLVISVDTAVLHLAGALGKQAWALLPFIADWRWLEQRTDSPWYPSLKLFRQSDPGQWEPVFAQLRDRLTQQVHSR